MPSRGPRAITQRVERAVAKVRSTVDRLRETLEDEVMMQETPLEVQSAIERAVEAVDAMMVAMPPQPHGSRSRSPGSPTRQQGQFLAYIREYMTRNHGMVAPTHADMQRFFNLTAPSVNSMLVRLEQRGFIRRKPRQARGITLTADRALIPELDRPFKW